MRLRDWFFGQSAPSALPMTSYGYLPPPGAVAVGWACTNYDCGRGDHEPVGRWPKPCPACGAATDPQLAEPWAHEARGVELRWLVTNFPQRGGGFNHDRWEAWQLNDALRRRAPGEASQVRSQIRRYTERKIQTDGAWWYPGSVYFHVVWGGLEAGDVDGVAEDLLYWLSVSSDENVEEDNSTRTNCRQVLGQSVKFLTGIGAGHSRASEIRRAALRLAQGAYPILNDETQNGIRAIARQV